MARYFHGKGKKSGKKSAAPSTMGWLADSLGAAAASWGFGATAGAPAESGPKTFVITEWQSRQLEIIRRDQQLTDIPISIDTCKVLEFLDLMNNRIGTFPNTLGALTALKKLRLSQNNISHIPGEALGTLRQLRELYLSQNNIDVLPEQIGGLQQLRELYVNGNKLRRLPPCVGTLEKLNLLVCHDNPMVSPMPSECGRGVETIKFHLTRAPRYICIHCGTAVIYDTEGAHLADTTK